MEAAVGLTATGGSSAVNSGCADTWQMWVVYTFSASPRREGHQHRRPEDKKNPPKKTETGPPMPLVDCQERAGPRGQRRKDFQEKRGLDRVLLLAEGRPGSWAV